MERSYNYELGGDFEFALGPGRLKLIGLERFEHSRYSEDAVFIYADGSPNTGGRYASVSESGEHIGRGEYSWKMLGGDWQLAAEAAFNRYNGEAHLFDLDAGGHDVRRDPVSGRDRRRDRRPLRSDPHPRPPAGEQPLAADRARRRIFDSCRRPARWG